MVRLVIFRYFSDRVIKRFRQDKKKKTLEEVEVGIKESEDVGLVQGMHRLIVQTTMDETKEKE